MRVSGSLLSANEQLAFFDWLRLHQQEEREQKIRETARKYAEHHYGQNGHPGGPAQIVWNTASSVGYVSPGGPKPMATTDFHSITIDVHPAVHGYARQLIAEMQIREQLDEIDEPYDD